MWWIASAFAAEVVVSPGGSIQDALDQSQAGDTVRVEAGTYVGDLTVDVPVALRASGAVVLQGDGTSGSVVRSTADFSLQGFVVDGLDAQRALKVQAGTVTVRNTLLQNGSATTVGGLVHVEGGAGFTALGGVSFANGTTPADGGGLYGGVGTTIELRGVSFTGCSADDGGAIEVEGGSLTIEGAIFTDNTADNGIDNVGGAVAIGDAGIAMIRYALFTGNSAASGGAVKADASSLLTVEHSRFLQNASTLVHVERGGGAVRCDGNASCGLFDNWYEANEAYIGAAVSLREDDSSAIRRSVFCDNDAVSTGFATVASDRSFQPIVKRSVFSGNTAFEATVDVFDLVSGAQVTRNTFLGNTATRDSVLSVDFSNGYTVTWNHNLVVSNTNSNSDPVVDGATFPAYNLYFGNSPSDASSTAPTDQFVDPELVAASGPCDPAGWVLDPSSAAVDAGDPGLPDDDGSPADIGAFSGGEGPLAFDLDGDGFPEMVDCDDTDPDVHIGAIEVCSGVDDDCNGLVDDADGGLTGAPTRYLDADGDGYGDPDAPVVTCAVVGFADNDEDCDDGTAEVNPGAIESCNGVDDDCNGLIDDDAGTVDFWPDADGDGFGDPGGTPVQACTAPSGFSGDATDCDDAQATINPGAAEICDGLDNDCDTEIDEGLPNQSYYADPDGDGWGSGAATVSCSPVPGLVSLQGDCDEADGSINPGAVEVCDGADNDCNGGIDDGLPQADYWADGDGDGYGAGSPAGQDCAAPPGSADQSGDCDDSDPTTFPGATEQCDALDNDCNGLVDDAVATTDWYADLDGDGYGGGFLEANCLQPAGTVANALDCDDDAATGGAINPDADEVCDALDNDCDGDIDDDDTGLVATLWYPDLDDDGFGDALAPGAAACSAPASTADNALDCADGDPAVNPQAVEACPDGIDNDCDTLVDQDDPNYTDQPVTYWFDQDGDGVGTPSLVVEACSGDAPLGYVPPTNGLDCDDAQVSVYPGAAEACDGLDNNCDLVVDEGFTAADYFPDADEDGYGDASATPIAACGPNLPEVFGLIDVGGDCDDADPNVNPDAVEVCDDGVDDDCDGADLTAFEQWPDLDGDGLGDPAGVTQSDCDLLSGYVDNADDCDDGDPDRGLDCTDPTLDTDGDGVPDLEDVDPTNPDDDGDGIETWREGTDDLDGDGAPNYADEDSDGDGLLDADEVGTDADCDGLDDYLDATPDDACPVAEHGCSGCDSRSGVPSAGWLVLALVMLRRRGLGLNHRRAL